MMQTTQKISLNKIQLLSLHIPKTAGTSFRNALKSVYGKSKVKRIDVDRKGTIRLDLKEFKGNVIPSGIKVVHGHFHYSDLEKYFENYESIPLITWVRDPIERVISNYNFLYKILREKVPEKPGEENILPRMIKSLEEFVRLEENQNVMSKFLDGADLNKFLFIGIQQEFDKDLSTMASLLNWKSFKSFEDNKTGKYMVKETNELIELIKSCNIKDHELYQQVLKLRKRKND